MAVAVGGGDCVGGLLVLVLVLVEGRGVGLPSTAPTLCSCCHRYNWSVGEGTTPTTNPRSHGNTPTPKQETKAEITVTTTCWLRSRQPKRSPAEGKPTPPYPTRRVRGKQRNALTNLQTASAKGRSHTAQTTVPRINAPNATMLSQAEIRTAAHTGQRYQQTAPTRANQGRLAKKWRPPAKPTARPTRAREASAAR